jgi:hypothetical protein
VLGVLGVLQVLSAQVVTAQVRDARPAPRGTAIISGVVIADDADSRPVRKARVTCGAPDVPGHTTISDANGRFTFTGLPAGRYTISAAKATWINTSYGAKRPGRSGIAIPLADGQRITVTIRMPRGSVITGVIVDHDNQRARGVDVRALQYRVGGGERRLTSIGQATTDDRGVYRIFGLAAGDYIVGAVPRGPLGSSELRLATGDGRGERGVLAAPAYYPGGTNVMQAGVVSLRAAEERDGIDFVLQLVPTARVDGTVSLPGGGVPAGTEINLIALGETAVPGLPIDTWRQDRVGADGAFMFAGVPPGQYTVLARGSRPLPLPDGGDGPHQILWASTQIAVDGEPVTGLALSLEPGLTLSGQVRFEGSSLTPPADLKAIRISATPVETRSNVQFAPGAVSASGDGRFTISGVTPGRYRLSASFPGSGRPGGWLMKSITANGQDALDAPLVIQPNQHVLDAVITFTDRLAEIAGTVQVPSDSRVDYTVIVFPEDQRLWLPQSRRIQATRPGADGAFTVRNLPAGNYVVVLADDVVPGEWFDPAFLQRLLTNGQRVALRDGERVTRDLRPAR